MKERKVTLSVTITPEAARLLERFLEDSKAQGWNTNKSSVVSNAIRKFCESSHSDTPPVAVIKPE